MNRIASFAFALSFSLLASACGGGSGAGSDGEERSVQATLAATADTAASSDTADESLKATALSVNVSSVAAAEARATTSTTSTTAATSSTGWTLCAAENGTCSFSGIRSVRYGAGDRVNEKVAANAIACSNDVFGDPIMGMVKSCWVSTAVQTRAAPAGWSWCGDESDTCYVTGTRQVRYGSGTEVVEKSINGSVNCSNWVFGDPIMGVVKSCWYQNDAVSVAVTPAAIVAPVVVPATVATVVPSPSSSVSSGGSTSTAASTVAAALATTTTDQGDDLIADQCESAPAMPTVPAVVRTLASFCTSTLCARPDDDGDDTDAIQSALDQATPGMWIVFGDGKYVISRSLRVKKPGVTLWGKGTTLHATNWDDQSLIVEANDTSIYNFKLTAVTGQRGGRAEHTRIAIYGPASVNPIVKNTIIRGNVITNAGEPGTNLANGATGAGIFVMSADGFLIADNTVVRTLADGIHMTGGARNGRVLNNTVRETGDDMIAVVSYAYPGDPATSTAASIADGFAAARLQWQDSNILVANNNVSGQYWGRGISVVGGRDITIRSNTISNIPYAAAVLVVRETPSGTYGVSNVLVENNKISDVQTLSPPYNFGNKFSPSNRTGHGAIEVHGSMFADENSYAPMVSGMSVTGLTIRNNTVTSSATPGVRIGTGSGTSWMQGNRAVTGNTVMQNIIVQGNVFKSMRTNPAMEVIPTTAGVAQCSANTNDGAAMTIARCTAPVTWTPVVGATLACSK